MVLILLGVLTGCATPPDVKSKAQSILGDGKCFLIFTDDGLHRYQHVAQMARAVFALAKDQAGQACGWASNRWGDVNDGVLISLPNYEKLETVAIARCEAAKQGTSVKSPCRIFARGNEVVWGNSAKIGME